MEFNLILLIILGFAAFRITRFFIIDSLLEGSRSKLHVFLANKARNDGKLSVFWEKALDLTSCTWCAGAWISLAVYSLYVWLCPLSFNQVDVLNVFAIAGVQGMLHALEPGDE